MENRNRLTSIGTALTAASVGLGLAREAKSRWDEKTLYYARVSEKSYVYPELMKWLNAETRTKRIKFVSTYHFLARHYDGNGNSNIILNGHSLQVSIEKPDVSNGMVYDAEYGETAFTTNVVFTGRSASAIDALETKLQELSEKRRQEAKSISLYTVSSYGWSEQNPTPRKMDSVFLPDGMKEGLIEDFDTFFKSERKFETIGLPWHRGYLFYGPPGNGKSSLAAALASHFKMNLYNMPLSAVKNDSALTDCIGGIQKNSILLLEDIDIFSKSMKREQADTGPTLAGLLNALDGVATPHGLVTIMTTNHIDVLDPALIRPGRIDKRVELKYPDNIQIEKMFDYVYGEPLRVEARDFTSMAELAEVFKKNCFDAEAARLEIKKG